MVFSKILDSFLVKSSKTLLSAILLLIAPRTRAEDFSQCLRRRLGGKNQSSKEISPPTPPAKAFRLGRDKPQDFDGRKHKIQNEIEKILRDREDAKTYRGELLPELNQLEQKKQELEAQKKSLEAELKTYEEDIVSAQAGLYSFEYLLSLGDAKENPESKEYFNNQIKNANSISKANKEEISRVNCKIAATEAKMKKIEDKLAKVQSRIQTFKDRENGFEKQIERYEALVEECSIFDDKVIRLPDCSEIRDDVVMNGESEIEGVTELQVEFLKVDAKGGAAKITFRWKSELWYKHCRFVQSRSHSDDLNDDPLDDLLNTFEKACNGLDIRLV